MVRRSLVTIPQVTIDGTVFMKLTYRILVLCLFVIFAAVPVAATDIGLIKITNQYQAEVATTIVGQAAWVDVNGFVVALDESQLEQLQQAGIDVDILMSNTTPSGTFLIRPVDRAPGPIDLSQLGRVSAVSPGLSLVQMSPSLAASVSSSGTVWVNSLENYSFPFFFAPPVLANTISEIMSYPTDTLADLVSLDSVYAVDQRLQDFQTRYIFSDSIDAARDWIVDKFHSWGYTDVTTPIFSYAGEMHYNVIAVKPGYAEPDKLVVVGGHYDSITYGQAVSPMEFAPGADDDGSGTTLVLELARVLAAVPLRKTVVFIAFSAEEQGLIGSSAAAKSYRDSGANIEVMFNYDMVGYDPNNQWGLDMSSGNNDVYRQISTETAARVTPLNVSNVDMGKSSDHYSFFQRGYAIVDNIETVFNAQGWHTMTDLTSKMNFPYMTDVVRTALASVAYVATAASPSGIAHVIDQGDGQSLELVVGDCQPDYVYTLTYGPDSTGFDHVEMLSPGECSWLVDGLTEGETYYFSVFATATDGYPSPYATMTPAVSLTVPRMPTAFLAASDTSAIELDWNDNTEADVAYYNIYRRMSPGNNYRLYQSGLSQSEFVDNDVLGGLTYYYRVSAIDQDGYESDMSPERIARLATFDQGILAVDETAAEQNINPPESEQKAWFDSLFSQIPYGYATIDSLKYPLSRSDAAPYSTIFWFDDDLSYHWILKNVDTLEWFLNFDNNNLLFAGWRTLYTWAGYSTIGPDNMLYSEFGITSYMMNVARDCAGAHGQSGWPSVSMDAERLGSKLANVPKLTTLPGAQVIYTYDSFTDNPDFEGQPCGVAYNTPKGKRIFLGFPISGLTLESAQALIQYAASHFDEINENPEFGDVNNNGKVDLGDVTRLIDCLYLKGLPLADPNLGDVNGSCEVNLGDVLYLIGYLYLGGDAPIAGCVQ